MKALAAHSQKSILHDSKKHYAPQLNLRFTVAKMVWSMRDSLGRKAAN